MGLTVKELRNEIRVAVGRFEREFNAQFTKEELAAIGEAVGYSIGEGPLPGKEQMRSGIRWKIGVSASEADADGGAFRKAELEAIAEAVSADEA